MAKILLIEDDPETCEMIAECLRFEHYSVEQVDNGTDGLSFLQTYSYDLAILDWGLPGLPGIEVLKKYRQDGGTTPVLLLTGRAEIDEKTQGLDTGADDYLTKPFHMNELLARVRALMRRVSPTKAGTTLTLGKLALDPQSHTVTWDGQELKLIPKEFSILEALLRQPGRVFSTDELLNKVWKAEESPGPEAIRTHIKNLRKKLEAVSGDPIVETVHGVGYKVSKAS